MPDINQNYYRVSAPSRYFLEGFVPTYLSKSPMHSDLTEQANGKIDKGAINASALGDKKDMMQRKAFSVIQGQGLKKGQNQSAQKPNVSSTTPSPTEILLTPANKAKNMKHISELSA